MSRRTEHKPIPLKPHVMLGNRPRISRSGKKAKTLIGQASRVLYLARKDAEAEAMREMLRAADPSEYVMILCAFVTFWPEANIAQCPTGDPWRHWSVNHMRPEQRRKEELRPLPQHVTVAPD